MSRHRRVALPPRWSGALGLLISACAAFLPACDEAGSDRGPSGARSGGTTLSPAAAAWPTAAATDQPGLDGRPSELLLALRPRLQPQRGISVMITLTGVSTAELAAFVVTPRWADTRAPRSIHDFSVADVRGIIEARLDEATGRYALSRGPVGGRVRASYFAAAPDQASRFDLSVSASGASGIGHSFLVLPELNEHLAVRVQWDLAAFNSATGATSYGVGSEVVTRARPPELAHSVYLAGDIVVREGGFGERFVLFGRPQFEAGAALTFCGEALHALRQTFEPGDREPYTFTFLARPHLGADHDGAALHQSFALWFDESRSFDPRLKILAAHEIVHRWVGSKIRLVTPGGNDARWFSEGFAAHYARMSLYRAGLLSGRAFVEDLNRSYDVQRRAFAHGTLGAEERGDRVTPDGGKPSDAPGPAEAAVASPHRASVVSHRGALYAARVDAQLRRKRRGSLDQVMASLLTEAKATPERALPEARWREVVVERLGAGAGREFERLIRRSEEPIDVPFDALGNCFVRTQAKDGSYELGFDPASLRSEPPVIRGLLPGSAAESAGLSNGDVVLSGQDSVREGDAQRTIVLVVTGKRGGRVVRFSPQSKRPRVRWQWRPSCGRKR